MEPPYKANHHSALSMARRPYRRERGTSIADDRGDVALDSVPSRIVTTGEEATELVVALGIKPVGVGSSRVDATKANPLEGYYLEPGQLGTPAYIGPDPFNFEAVAALEPDLIVHYFDDANVATFEDIAPTVVFDVQAPGTWQEAVRRLGRGLGREQKAAASIAAFDEALTDAQGKLAEVVSQAPRITVTYPNYRGGSDNYLFDADFALAEVFVKLGFELVGIEKAAPVFPGVGTISTELYGTIETDTVVAIGPVDWTTTPSGPFLATVDAPVLGVIIDENWPAAGPLTSVTVLERYVAALTAEYAS